VFIAVPGRLAIGRKGAADQAAGCWSVFGARSLRADTACLFCAAVFFLETRNWYAPEKGRNQPPPFKGRKLRLVIH
jgi:hypothetical protein